MSILSDCPGFEDAFRVCELEPFVSQVTQTEPPSGHAIEIMKEEIERYLQRMQESVCADFELIRCVLESLQNQIVPPEEGLPGEESMALEAYGQIYSASAGSSQTIGTAGVFELMDQFLANGLALGTVPDAAGDRIVLNTMGVWLVFFQLSFGGTNSSTHDLQVRWNGSLQPQVKCGRRLGGGGDIGSVSAVGLIDATVAARDLELYWTAGMAGDTLDLVDGQLVTAKIS